MARHIVTYSDLVAIARRVGVKVVQAPSSHRGKRGEMGTIKGVTCHYTGTPNSYRPELEYPDYNVVKEGRAGLLNSLSAYGLGRHSTIYVFSEDLSWHAGNWSWRGITDGNGHFLGIETAGIGDWTPFQRRVYPRLVAAILLFIDEGIDMAPTHAAGAMPRGRKVDFKGGSLNGFLPELFTGGRNFYDAVQWLMDNPAYININYKGPAAAPEEDDDMPTTVSEYVEPGQRKVIALPPALSGSIRWGRIYVSLVTDSFGDAKFPADGVDVRAYVLSDDGTPRRWNPKSPYVRLKSAQRVGGYLEEGERGLIITAPEGFGVGVAVEIDKA